MEKKSQTPEFSLGEFLAECDELTQRLFDDFALLEGGDVNPERIDSIYRDIHSLKGSALLFGFASLGELAHAMESSLDPVRRKELEVSGSLIAALFKCMELIEKILVAIRNKQDFSFRAELEECIPGLVHAATRVAGGDVNVTNEFPYLAENLKALPQSVNAEKTEAPPSGSQPPSPIDIEKDSASTIRVPVALLDRLMTLMGEMVLVRNQVLQYSSRSDDLEFLNLSQRLNVVTSEIQGEMMKTRMQPIGNIMNKFTRVVRDISRELGKKVELNLSGAETELDKTLLEAVKDPLTHIVRNSCDHGIEMPEERRSAGKPETGAIFVRSYHEGGQVIIEVRDDGRGLHRTKLIAKAVEKGLISSERAESLSDREAWQLIFAPGFSTAAKITNVSGRGVGMDVVKSNIDRIGGGVELSSEEGRGTTIRLKIPLTLAIVPAMIVRCGDDRYAIPQVKLVELVRVNRTGSENIVEYLQGNPVYRLRGNLLPLIDLKGVLKYSNGSVGALESDVINIVVVNAEKQFFGMIVDEILDTADIVVKPLNRFLKSLSTYSGATVLGDGSVAIILDVLGIARTQLLVSEGKAEAADKNISTMDGRIKGDSTSEFLLFKVRAPAKHAILLTYVHRLEEFKRSAIELSGSQRVVRYRNSVLPLISINQVLGLREADSGDISDVVSVIVTQRGDQFFGLEVDEILDVLTTEGVPDTSISDRSGILGNLGTDQEIVVVVDPQRILADASKTLSMSTVEEIPTSRKKESSSRTKSAGGLKILLAEDMVFFRKTVTAILEQAGHTVTTVKDGKEAIERLRHSDRNAFDLVISDIEMPHMGGLKLAETIRTDSEWSDIPLVALTTRSGKRSADEGFKAGFDSYLEKTNPDELLRTIEGLTAKPRRSA